MNRCSQRSAALSKRFGSVAAKSSQNVSASASDSPPISLARRRLSDTGLDMNSTKSEVAAQSGDGLLTGSCHSAEGVEAAVCIGYANRIDERDGSRALEFCVLGGAR